MEVNVWLGPIGDSVINAKLLHSSKILRINIVSHLRGKNVKTEEEKVSWSKIKSNELKNKKLEWLRLMFSQTILN